MKLNIENRFHAFTVHFIISFTIISTLLLLIIYWWYPPPYFELEGGQDILEILFGVDVVLGPCITLIIFKKGKPGLIFDLSVIAFMQVSALIYGSLIIYHERPAFLVFSVDRFTIVSTQDIDTRFLLGTDLNNDDSRGPTPVFTSIPDNIDERNKLLFETLTQGAADIEFRAEYYEPFQPNLKKAILRGKDIGHFYTSNKNKIKIDEFIANNEIPIKDLSFFPVIGKKKDMLIAINNTTGEIIGAIDIDPWIKY